MFSRYGHTAMCAFLLLLLCVWQRNRMVFMAAAHTNRFDNEQTFDTNLDRILCVRSFRHGRRYIRIKSGSNSAICTWTERNDVKARVSNARFVWRSDKIGAQHQGHAKCSFGSHHRRWCSLHGRSIHFSWTDSTEYILMLSITTRIDLRWNMLFHPVHLFFTSPHPMAQCQPEPEATPQNTYAVWTAASFAHNSNNYQKKTEHTRPRSIEQICVAARQPQRGSGLIYPPYIQTTDKHCDSLTR